VGEATFNRGELEALSAAQVTWRWRILTASYFAYGGYYLTRKTFTICKTTIAKELHWQLGETAHIWTAYLVAYMIGMFINSFLGRRWGPRVLLLGGLGLWVLVHFVNPLTMWLTLATFVGYAIVYTVILKPMTPQNIVIGGASGAMPPVLGWTAVTGDLSSDALLLFLIIFAWTPPHFWALALYRKREYAKAGIPMLPVTHGDRYTRLHVLLYTLILLAVSMLPFATRMSGLVYLASALALGGLFVWYGVRIYVAYSDRLAQQTFRYSIVYLSLLFAALLADHYWRILV
jgi:MFS family permease